MALDTTIGGPNSDSYSSLADFQGYAAKLNWDLSGKTVAEQEAALRRAAQWIDRAHSFVGSKVSKAQALEWPRYTGRALQKGGFPVDADEIPRGVFDAQMEMAWNILSGEDPMVTTTDGVVKSKSVKAGPVSNTVEFVGATASKRYAAIDGLLDGLVVATGELVRG